MTALRDFPESPGVQQYGCWALASLAATDTLQELIAMNGGVELVLSALRNHLVTPGVQQFGCWAIRNLAENAENRVYIGQVGGLQAVAEPMKVHPTRAEVVLQATWAVARLARNAANRVAFCSPAIHVETCIVAGMTAHPYFADLQRRCCQAIATLCMEEENQLKCAAVDAVELVMAAMSLHPESKVVQESAMWSLSWLAAHPQNQVHATNAGLCWRRWSNFQMNHQFNIVGAGLASPLPLMKRVKLRWQRKELSRPSSVRLIRM